LTCNNRPNHDLSRNITEEIRRIGRAHIATTMRYLHLAQSRLTRTTSPLDLLAGR
jgi:hypothetical protein